MICCGGLTKNYGTLAAVSDVTLDVAGGSICAVLGPNGAGKSTLVRMLTGLVRATRGSAEVCGLPVSSPSLRTIAGILPETLALFNDLTVAEHLELTGAVYKLRKEDITSRSQQLLRVLRLDGARRTFIHECSYGMKKKTALAMALLPNPRALFLDEPFEGIDPVTAETIRLLLSATAQRGVTILLTSHILSLVDRLADKVVMINHGRIVLDAKTSELPNSLEDLYFELVESAATEDLGWLGSQP
jgi:ABC-2 type transport system ATP-binding protein